MSLRAEAVHAAVRDPARAVALRGDGVEVAGEQQRRRRRAGEHARVAEVAHRDAAGAEQRRPRAPRGAPRRATPTGCRPARASARRAALPGPARGGTIASTGRALLRRRHLGQARQPAARDAARAARARGRRRARGDVLRARHGRAGRRARSRASAAAQAVVAVDAPSGPRLDLLAAGAPLRAALGLPDGRYERMRVCDALLFRRGLPLYPVPGRRPGAAGAGSSGSASASSCSPRSPGSACSGRRRAGGGSGRSGAPRCASGGCARPTRTRSSAACSATARRPSARRGGCSSGSPRCA